LRRKANLLRHAERKQGVAVNPHFSPLPSPAPRNINGTPFYRSLPLAQGRSFGEEGLQRECEFGQGRAGEMAARPVEGLFREVAILGLAINSY
jgi:hypothetical protein